MKKIYQDSIKLKNICPICSGEGKWYGMAPHRHNLKKTGSFIGSTEILDKKEWPSNFIPDLETGSHQGIWTCERCNGDGVI